MFFYEGCGCPVCGESFRENDDIVTCPECGTPHHRECYKTAGGCANADKHSEGFEWKKEADSGAAGTVCELCGEKNPEGRMFCQRCGSPLGENTYNTEYADGQAQKKESESAGYYAFGGGILNISDGEMIDGVPVGDIKRFIGGMWYFYVPMFQSFFKKVKSVSFSLSACILHGIWFISRKMYVLGGVILALMLGLTGFRVYFSGELMPAYQQWLDGDMTGMMAFVQQRPVLSLALAGSTVVQYAVYILSGLFANRIYMTHCIKSIKRINATAENADQFNDMLESHGGTSMMLSLVVAAFYFIAQYYLSTLL